MKDNIMIIILSDGYGQMCNKLYNQMNVIATALDNNVLLKYYNFREYGSFNYTQDQVQKLLEKKTKTKAVKVYFKLILLFRKLLPTSIRKNVIIIESQNTTPNVLSKTDAGYLCTHKMMFSGWPFVNLDALRKHKKAIQQYYSSKMEMVDYVNSTIEYQKRGSNILVGVHIRRGDYKYWNDGQFFYENEVYKYYMDELYNQLNNRDITFFVFSNETIDEKYFADDKYRLVFPHGNPEQDFHTLKSMDYIIGPPSTFSGIASFLGDVPRYIITEKKATFSLAQMKIWLSETDNDGNPI